jgi:16S rRNA (guanine527-N7)-methyltransferase
MEPAIAALRPELAHCASQVTLDLGETQLDRLLAYLDLLQRWNKVYNLTAVREPQAMLHQHLVDCLAVVPSLRRQQAALKLPAAPAVLDVGSGGGLPGVVLAIVEPAMEVTCIDTVAKKAGFVRQVAAELGLANLHVEHARVEALAPGRRFDLVTSRAFASLPDFVGWTRHLLAPGGVWMAMKGAVPEDEIAELPPDVEMFHVERLAVPGLDARRCLVWIRKRTPT